MASSNNTSTHQPTWCHNAAGHTFNVQQHENLISYVLESSLQSSVGTRDPNKFLTVSLIFFSGNFIIADTSQLFCYCILKQFL